MEKRLNGNNMNAMSCFEQILGTQKLHKTVVIQPLSISQTIQVRRTRHAGHCKRSKDVLISDILLWTPTLRCARIGQPEITYISSVRSMDVVWRTCSYQWMISSDQERERERERVRAIRA